MKIITNLWDFRISSLEMSKYQIVVVTFLIDKLCHVKNATLKSDILDYQKQTTINKKYVKSQAFHEYRIIFDLCNCNN
jgi:hypothetical protein